MLLWYLLANLHAERFIFVKLNADISLWLKFFGVEFYYGSVFTLKSHEVITSVEETEVKGSHLARFLKEWVTQK